LDRKGDNMGEVVKLQKSGKNLVITIPTVICENLDLKEGNEVEIEQFTCGGENGLRIRLKK
ncbi:MAG: AbrB/MazE/SpoVT family DNA-binding domain-containing protein, partial [Candidatus Methanoperedens sp.]|nr:AbrB/MazE/SpoVT family DNA-binding domain-containing protein [Candidatus Methanoperedens sp.]